MTTDTNLFAVMRAEVLGALRQMLPDLPEEALARVLVEPPRDATHGDMATNAAMVVAKPARLPPPKLAADLAQRLAALPMVEEAAPAGPGFVNLRLRDGFVRSLLPGILRAGDAFGDATLGRGRRVNVEYVSANPTGPMHVGHCRGAVVGDALAALLAKAGWEVTREYYINDAGAQVQALAWAAYWRYLQALGTNMTEEAFGALPPGGLQYRGEYLLPVGQALKDRFGDSLAEPGAQPADPSRWLDTVRDFAVDRMMEAIREDLAALGVRHDVFISERALVERGALEEAEALLRSKDLIYTGVLDPPKGKTPDDWEPRPQTLFKATAFGDDVDRPLRKSDGSGTYFANAWPTTWTRSAAASRSWCRLGRGPRRLRQAHAGGGEGAGRGAGDAGGRAGADRPRGEERRAGAHVEARRHLRHAARPDRGGRARRGALHHADAQGRRADGVRPRQGVEQSRDNPVFYVQYAHARCRSVLRQAATRRRRPGLRAARRADGPGRDGADPAHGGVPAHSRSRGVSKGATSNRLLSP
jgi:arginyl-tRNA synthetase